MTSSQTRKVWKIGATWGGNGPSVKDFFYDHNIVFFSPKECKRLGDYNAVKEGDLFIIFEGQTPVAMAYSLGSFQQWKPSMRGQVSTKAVQYLEDNDIIFICRVHVCKFADIPDLFTFVSGRFKGYNVNNREVIDLWEKYTTFEGFEEG